MRAKWVAVAVAGAGAAYAADRARRGRRALPAGPAAPAALPVALPEPVAPLVLEEPEEPEAAEPVEPVASPEPVADEVLTATGPLEPVRDEPEPEPDPEPDPEPASEQAIEPEPEDQDEDEEPGSTKVALSGFYTGLVCMLFAPVLYFSATDWLFEAETSAQLTPFVLLLLAVPAILVAVPRTRRFGLYMVLGLALTGVVVATTAIVVLFLLFRAG